MDGPASIKQIMSIRAPTPFLTVSFVYPIVHGSFGPPLATEFDLSFRFVDRFLTDFPRCVGENPLPRREDLQG